MGTRGTNETSKISSPLNILGVTFNLKGEREETMERKYQATA